LTGLVSRQIVWQLWEGEQGPRVDSIGLRSSVSVGEREEVDLIQLLHLPLGLQVDLDLPSAVDGSTASVGPLSADEHPVGFGLCGCVGYDATDLIACPDDEPERGSVSDTHEFELEG